MMLYRLVLLAVLVFSHQALSDGLDDGLKSTAANSAAAETIETEKAVNETSSAVIAADTVLAPPPKSTARPAPNTTTVGSGVVTADPFTVVFGLLFIVALIFIIAWVLRRFGAVSMAHGQAMKIISVLPVGSREKVLLIDVAGQQLLLGVAPGRVSHLQSFDQPVVSPSTAGPNEFTLKIKQLLQTADNTAVKK